MKKTEKTIKKLKALSDETRLRIINLLYKENLSECQIYRILDMSQPRISRHLKILKDADLIAFKNKGRLSIFSINFDENKDLLDCVKKTFEEEIFKEDIKRINTIKACYE